MRKRRALQLIAVAALLVLAMIAFLRPAQPTLASSFGGMVADVEGTAALLPELTFRVDEDNADLQLAPTLPTSRWFGDHSNQSRWPGYNDCDGWQQFGRDRWRASYAMTAELRGMDIEPVIRRILSSWGRDGGGEAARSAGVPIVFSDDRSSHTIQVTIDDRRQTVQIQGTTHCLAPH